MKSKIVITQPMHAVEVDRLRAAGHHITEVASPRGLTSAELVAVCADADVLVCQLTDQISQAIFESSRLRAVANIAAGVDNIDVAAAVAAEVVVTHTPGVLTDASADLTMALLLATARHIPFGDASVREGGTGPWRLLHEPMGIDVFGSTLGVFGMGRIGLATARRAHHGFGMQVIYHSRRRHPVAEAEVDAIWVPLDELFRRCDVLTLHAPMTDETRHVVNDKTLALMQPHAILVNTARGGLVDEAALARALTGGTIAGAGLDVFEQEPDVHPDLLDCGSRTVLTPHVGSATSRTRLAMSSMAVDDVLAVLNGEPPEHPVPGGLLRAISS